MGSVMVDARRTPHRAIVALLLSALAIAPVAACSGAQGPPDSVLKPLEERRARAIIEQGLLESGARPVAPRTLNLADGSKLVEDMAIEGGTYGIAYITTTEESQMSPALPKRDPESDQLQLVRAGEDAIVLLLWEQNYRFDAGSEHTATALTAERKLKRDVEDFVLHYVQQGKRQ
jgi:hypothetical protein